MLEFVVYLLIKHASRENDTKFDARGTREI